MLEFHIFLSQMFFGLPRIAPVWTILNHEICFEAVTRVPRLLVESHLADRYLVDFVDKEACQQINCCIDVLCRSNVCRPNDEALVVSAKNCVGQMSFGQMSVNQMTGPLLCQPKSVWDKCLSVKCLLVRHLPAKCLMVKYILAKCLLAKCPLP